MVEDDRDVRWRTPRPEYMREIEPLALPEVWISKKPVTADSDSYSEARINRELFEKGKINSGSYRRRAAAIALGKSA